MKLGLSQGHLGEIHILIYVIKERSEHLVAEPNLQAAIKSRGDRYTQTD